MQVEMNEIKFFKYVNLGLSLAPVAWLQLYFMLELKHRPLWLHRMWEYMKLWIAATTATAAMMTVTALSDWHLSKYLWAIICAALSHTPSNYFYVRVYLCKTCMNENIRSSDLSVFVKCRSLWCVASALFFLAVVYFLVYFLSFFLISTFNSLTLVCDWKWNKNQIHLKLRADRPLTQLYKRMICLFICCLFFFFSQLHLLNVLFRTCFREIPIPTYESTSTSTNSSRTGRKKVQPQKRYKKTE